MKNNRIYIAGPISSIPAAVAERKFKDARLLLAWGYEVVDPFQLNKGKVRSWLGYMIVDFFHLIKCDNIYMLEGWQNSKGAKIEHCIARLLRFKIIYEIK